MNAYIESIEGGNYLVATGDDCSRTLVFNENKRPKVFHCLEEIRVYFANQHFKNVWLTQSTPYDEMVGQPHLKTQLVIKISLN